MSRWRLAGTNPGTTSGLPAIRQVSDTLDTTGVMVPHEGSYGRAVAEVRACLRSLIQGCSLQLTPKHNGSDVSRVGDVCEGISVEQHEISRVPGCHAAGVSKSKYAAGLSVAVRSASAVVIPPCTNASNSSCTHASAIMPSHPVMTRTPAFTMSLVTTLPTRAAARNFSALAGRNQVLY